MIASLEWPHDHAATQALPLVPYRDALRDGATWTATSSEPWLRLQIEMSAVLNRWIELTYDVGLCDEVTRPVLRFVDDAGEYDVLLSGAPFGRAVWLGFVRPGTRALLLSPVKSPGPFAFRVARLRTILEFGLALEALRARPSQLFRALGSRLIGRRDLAERYLRRAIYASPVEAYETWRRLRGRDPEWTQFDRPPRSTARSPHIRILACRRSPEKLTDLERRLRDQPWPSWSLAVVDSQAAPQISRCFREEGPFTECLADLDPDDLAMPLNAADAPLPEMLPAIGVAAQRNASDVFFGDEERTAPAPLPLLKPDWSPIFASQGDFLGRAWIARVGWARARLGDRRAIDVIARPLSVPPDARVVHIRRVLTRGPAKPGRERPLVELLEPLADKIGAGPRATIVIPTGARLELLKLCVASLHGARSRTDFEAIIISNGAPNPTAERFFEDLCQDNRFRVLRRPGPFNFSGQCNEAAREARADTLVFLNDDVEVRSPEWLERLLSWTARPEIGAVGAKLLYPDGRLQHAGVTLGLGGVAAHFERFAWPDADGYFGRANLPHEISAVTGACLAVAKAKFEAVSGFDATNLPVEFSDIDLCLRLAERGWKTLLEPAVALVHHESASRRARFPTARRYSAEFAYFRSRWRQALRDDGCFHPALSLDWPSAALA